MEENQGPKLNNATVLLLTAAGCALYAVAGGMRNSFGVMLKALAAHSGVDYAGVSFVAAVGQLMYGLTQPFFGMLALKKSNGFVLALGVLLMGGGLLLTTAAHSQALLLVSVGLLLFGGTGAVCFGIIMGTLSPILGKTRAAGVSGILNAASGVGTMLLSPVIQALQSHVGISMTLLLLCAPVAAIFPIVLWIARLAKAAAAASPTAAAAKLSVWARLRGALAEHDYRCLMAGFATCGFHMCIISSHVYSQVVSYGISERVAALTYTLFGATSMLGSVLSGLLCQKLRLKNVLGTLYGIRAVMVALFLFAMPKAVWSVFLFIMVLGLTGDATVTPTSEIISRCFGPASLGFLFGITFVCHQIGGFLSTWLGGVFIVGGSYTAIWLADSALCAFASTVSFMIRSRE